MDYALTNKARANTMFFPSSGYIDIEIGGNNNMKVSLDTDHYDKDKVVGGGYIYQSGTELGGLLNEFSSDTSKKEIYYTGPTFRGMLEDRYCEPTTGQDYRIISGELNQGIALICGSTLYGGLFQVSEEDTGITLSNITISRDVTLLEACEEFLKQAEYKLKISAVEYEENDIVKFYVKLEAEPITDYSDTIENSQDGLINFTITKAPEIPYNYMLCLGKGELKDRERFRYKIESDGSLTEVQSFPDAADTRVYKYDYSSYEDMDSFLKSAQKKAEEINGKDTQKISLSESMKVWLGDIVGGRDYLTDKRVTEPITKIVYKLKYGEESLAYTIGG